MEKKGVQNLLSSIQSSTTNVYSSNPAGLADETTKDGVYMTNVSMTTSNKISYNSTDDDYDDISNNGSNTSEEDYVSASSDDDHSGHELSDLLGDDIETTLISSADGFDINNDFVTNIKFDHSDYVPINQFSNWQHGHSRPRSLSRISEASHVIFDPETKDDFHFSKTNTFGAKSDLYMKSSETTLTGRDYEHAEDHHHDIFYDARSPSGYYRHNVSEILPERDSAILSGNVTNDHSNINNRDYINHPNVNPHLLSNITSVIPTDVASESTPKPLESVIFKFPDINSGLQKSIFNTSIPPGNTEYSTSMQPLTSVKNDDQTKLTTPTIIVAEATVHETKQETSDIPLSLRNLLFLTKPDVPNSSASENGSLSIMNPGFMLTNEGKRSNLKKTPATLLASTATTTANSSLCGSSTSINTIGSKKSIKWGSDVPDTNKGYTEPLSSQQQDATRCYGQSTSKESHLSRDNSRKMTIVQKAAANDKNYYVNVILESEDGTDNKLFRRDYISTRDAERMKENDGSLFRTSSGHSTPMTSSGHSTQIQTIGTRELKRKDIVRALKGFQERDANCAEENSDVDVSKTDQEVISMNVVSSIGGLSTPGDVTPNDYLTDVEDTVTSFDELQRRDQVGLSDKGDTNTATVHNHGLVTSEGQGNSVTNNRSHVEILPESLKNSLVVIISCIYGIMLIVLGLVLPLTETFADLEHPYFFEIFYLYLYTVSMIFLIYVYTYLLRKESTFIQTLPKTISRTLSRTFSRSSMRSRSSALSEKSIPTCAQQLIRHNSTLSTTSLRRKRKIAYNSEASNHTGSFYLRVGVIGFGIGSMIHSGLTFGLFLEASHLENDCSEAFQTIKPLAHVCFTFVQMYFIFMNSKMCVHKYKTFARFGLMHMSCTNICVWLRSVVIQTLHVIKVNRRETYDNLLQAYNEHKTNSEEDSEERDSMQTLDEYLKDHQMGSMPEISCRWDTLMGKIVESSSVYLYPCTIEYSLMCACVLYVMWSNVGQGDTARRIDSSSDYDTLDSDTDSQDDNGHHKMSVDCAASSRGLFLGILLFVVAVVCVVCFYVLTSVKSHVTIGTLLGHVSEEIILIVAFIATVIPAFQMRNMRFTGKRKIGIEEILTLVSISGLGLYGIWSIIAAVFCLETLHGRLTLVTNLFMLIQAGSQATFTLAALRASARNHQQLREKPGRQCVTFLLISNFALWVVNTFETQRIEYNTTQIDFYGTTAWAIFSHISVPLGIYFRFHSTVNLSIVWKKAWKKTNSHDLEQDST